MDQQAMGEIGVELDLNTYNFPKKEILVQHLLNVSMNILCYK
jgi:hypothetical protein